MPHIIISILLVGFLASTGAIVTIVAACAMGGVGRRVL